MLSNQAKIESLLFVSGAQGITLGELAQLTGLLKPAILEQLEKLDLKYKADKGSCLALLQADERYRLATKKSFSPLVRQYFESPTVTELSGAALETLAIIAYKQPVTRIDIDEIRGVQSSGMVQKLLLLDLIAENGRLDLPGRPILYVTTENFLDYFGLQSLSDLPPLEKNITEDEKEPTDTDYLELFQQTLASNDNDDEGDI